MTLLTVKQVIGTYGSNEFSAYVKRISQVSSEFLLVRVRCTVSRRSMLTHLGQKIYAIVHKRRTVIASAELDDRQSHKIVVNKFKC